jgi:hypothetical protein
MITNIDAENAKTFICEKCDFKCFKLSNYNKHLLTAKHKRITNDDKKNAKNKTEYICSCGREFGYRQTLHRHKKTCNGVPPPTVAKKSTPTTVFNNEELLNVIAKQQEETTELKKLLIEQQENHFKQMQEQMKEQQEEHNKQIQHLIPQLQQVTNISNNNCNNTTNNKFNLNFFLNEQCKDAISIQNFIENLNIGIPELEHMGNVGYVQGMMSIFSNTLGAMDIYKRPLHCTDLKRETLYIKQGNTWKKDTEDKTELKKLIKTVEYKNYGSLRLWEREHPEAFECDTQDNIDYLRISNESLGGFDSTDAIKLGKIMKHVVREVYIK